MRAVVNTRRSLSRSESVNEQVFKRSDSSLFYLHNIKSRTATVCITRSNILTGYIAAIRFGPFGI
jgi:hypothetical protein